MKIIIIFIQTVYLAEYFSTDASEIPLDLSINNSQREVENLCLNDQCLDEPLDLSINNNQIEVENTFLDEPLDLSINNSQMEVEYSCLNDHNVNKTEDMSTNNYQTKMEDTDNHKNESGVRPDGNSDSPYLTFELNNYLGEDIQQNILSEIVIINSEVIMENHEYFILTHNSNKDEIDMEPEANLNIIYQESNHNDQQNEEYPQNELYDIIEADKGTIDKHNNDSMTMKSDFENEQEIVKGKTLYNPTFQEKPPSIDIMSIYPPNESTSQPIETMETVEGTGGEESDQSTSNIIMEVKILVDFCSTVIDNILDFFYFTNLRDESACDDIESINTKIQENICALERLEKFPKINIYDEKIENIKKFIIWVSENIKSSLLKQGFLYGLNYNYLRDVSIQVEELISYKDSVFLLLTSLKDAKTSLRNITSIICYIFRDLTTLESNLGKEVKEYKRKICIIEMLILIIVANSDDKGFKEKLNFKIEHQILMSLNQHDEKTIKQRFKYLSEIVNCQNERPLYNNTITIDNYCLVISLLGFEYSKLSSIVNCFYLNYNLQQNDMNLLKRTFVY